MKRALVITGDGLGNAIQSTPVMSELMSRHYTVDVWAPGAPHDLAYLLGLETTVGGAPPRPLTEYEVVVPNWMMAHRAPGHPNVKPGLPPIVSGLSESMAHWKALGAPPEDFRGTWSCYTISEKKPQGERRVALHAGGKTNHPWQLKRYPQYVDVAASLLKMDPDLHIYLLGTPGDGGLQFHERIHDLRGNQRLDLVAGFIKQCHVFLGNDAGLAHVAAAIRVPTLILFGPTEIRKNLPPQSAVPITGGPLPCRPCQRGTAGIRDGERCGHECMTGGLHHWVQGIDHRRVALQVYDQLEYLR